MTDTQKHTRHTKSKSQGKKSDTETQKNTQAGNTKKPPACRSRAWCFTLNNYEEDDIKFFTDTLDTEKFMFQEEMGESGTPHLQGTIYFINARTFNQMKQMNSKCHWEITKCLKGSVNYCCDIKKRNGRVFSKGWSIPKELKIIKELYPWQQKIVDLINTEPNDRTIHWFWEPEGNKGKTALSKYILTKYENVLFFTGGATKDITYQVIKNKIAPQICIFNFAREKEEKVSYSAIEQLKDGLVSCGKYEGGTKVFDSPHIIIFANWLPNTNRLSKDRWIIEELD